MRPNKQLIEYIDKIIYTVLIEVQLPTRNNIVKLVSNDDVQDYYGNTPYNLKIFKQWGNNSGEFKTAELYKGHLTGNHSKQMVKYVLRTISGKTYNVIASLYVHKDILNKIL